MLSDVYARVPVRENARVRTGRQVALWGRPCMGVGPCSILCKHSRNQRRFISNVTRLTHDLQGITYFIPIHIDHTSFNNEYVSRTKSCRSHHNIHHTTPPRVSICFERGTWNDTTSCTSIRTFHPDTQICLRCDMSAVQKHIVSTPQFKNIFCVDMCVTW